MPRDRFVAIKGKLTFAFRGRAGEAPARAKSSGRYDRLWKVRRLLDSMLAWGKQLFEPGVYIVIDEMMVFCRGKLAFFVASAPASRWRASRCALTVLRRTALAATIGFNMRFPNKPTRDGVCIYAICDSVTG